MKLGAKIHLGKDSLEIVKKLVKFYDFIEVYYIKHHLFDSTINKLFNHWVVHCPHHEDEINLALNKGINHVKSSIIFAGNIKAKYAIIHVGFLDIKQNKDKNLFIKNAIKVIKNLNIFAKKHKVKLLVENVPVRAIAHNEIGSNLEEMKIILKETGCGFCLDFSHAYHASVSYKIDYKKFIKDMYKLKPTMFHLYDGISGQEVDSHLPLGKGNLDIPFFLKFIKNEFVTLEISPATLENYLDGIKYLKTKTF
jgi:sugar phosphate isomerase/epimerase